MAIIHEIITNITNSFDNNFHKLNTEAPTTFRIPISLVRCSATKDAKPKSPRQEIKMASIAKKAVRLLTLSSLLNFSPKASSANW